MALGVGVELGVVGVSVVSSVGEAVALPDGGDGEAAGLEVAVEDEAGETVRLGAGDGLALPVGGVAVVVADVGVSVGSRLGGDGVADGAGGVPVSKTGEAETSASEMPEAPSADEARGKLRNKKSPTSDRTPVGLNRRTFTPSS